MPEYQELHISPLNLEPGDYLRVENERLRITSVISHSTDQGFTRVGTTFGTLLLEQKHLLEVDREIEPFPVGAVFECITIKDKRVFWIKMGPDTWLSTSTGKNHTIHDWQFREDAVSYNRIGGDE